MTSITRIGIKSEAKSTGRPKRLPHSNCWTNRQRARMVIFEYIEGFFNTPEGDTPRWGI
jgi:hypothetical protein